MKLSHLLTIVAVLSLAMACGWHESPQPNGTGHRGDIPEGVTAMVNGDAFPEAHATAGRCADGDFAACARTAALLEHGAEVPYYSTCLVASGHGGDHGDEHGDEHAEEHGDEHAEAHGDEHSDDHAEAHGDEHAEEHADEHAEAHGDEHSDDHAEAHGEGCAPVVANPSGALALYQVACDAGWHDGCVSVVRLGLAGEGGATTDGAVEMLQAACDFHHHGACVELAANFVNGRLEVDEDTAFNNLHRACAEGSAAACGFDFPGRNIHSAPTRSARDDAPLLYVQRSGATRLVSATVNSQGAADALLERANQAFGADAVAADIRVDSSFRNMDWLNSAPALFVMLNQLGGSPSFALYPDEVRVRGAVDSEEARDAVVRGWMRASSVNVNARVSVNGGGRSNRNVQDPNLASSLQSAIVSFTEDGRVDFGTRARLDVLAEALAGNPQEVLEVRSWVATTASDSDDMLASQRRADAVRDYLWSRGANVNQIIAVGLGAARGESAIEIAAIEPNSRI